MSFSNFNSYQKRILIILTLINFVNWIDRQVLYPLFLLIKNDFAVSYAQLGLLVAAFSLVHSFGALGLGRLGDRVSRRKVITYGLFFWSGATFLSGMAASFRSLMGARAMVGVGEAAYGPSATAIISGSFPTELRARVQGIFDLGMFVGGASGIILGGVLAASLGWRPAFFIVGIPGLALAFAIIRLPETRRERVVGQVPFQALLRVPAYLVVLVSGGFLTFAGHSYIIWGPEFVHRYKGLGLCEAGVLLGAILVFAGILGVMTGAALADRLARRYAWGRVLTISIGFLVSSPFILCSLHTSNRVLMLGAFAMGTFFMTWYHGPVTATIHDLVPPRAHSTAMGVYYFLVNLIATTAAAWLVGVIADHFGLLAGMHTALVAQVIGALGFFLVIHLIRQHGLHHPSLASYRAEDKLEADVCPVPA